MGLKFCSLSFQEAGKKKNRSFLGPIAAHFIVGGVLHLGRLNYSDVLLCAVVLPPTLSQDLQAPVLWHRTTGCLA